ncbi:MAG: hypothetical protein ABI477_23365 [Chryseolinea sp.]
MIKVFKKEMSIPLIDETLNPFLKETQLPGDQIELTTISLVFIVD